MIKRTDMAQDVYTSRLGDMIMRGRPNQLHAKWLELRKRYADDPYMVETCKQHAEHWLRVSIGQV